MLFCSEPPKVAVTELAALNVMLQLVVPVHPPDHPAKVSLVMGVALSVTAVPCTKLAVQAVVEEFEQLIPAGLLVTVPAPAPAKTTVSGSLLGGGSGPPKVAVTELAALMVTLQLVVPVHAPDHPVNVSLVMGAAVSVTAVPWTKLAEQATVEEFEQLMPAGLLVTVPAPAPAKTTVSGSLLGGGSEPPKVAVTELAALNVTLQPAAPVQPPDHPVKVSLVIGVAVRVTAIP
jgi:hypothetical protein